MKKHTFIFISVYLILAGCIHNKINSLRLYNLDTGYTISSVLSEPKYNQGTIYTTSSDSEYFEGEYYIYGDRARISHYEQMEVFNNASDLAERYGFGENANAKPVGTAIMIGNLGTVIQIVFYKTHAKLKAGDGIASDNKGNYYRVYLSEKE
jgi:hypothetical protein